MTKATQATQATPLPAAGGSTLRACTTQAAPVPTMVAANSVLAGRLRRPKKMPFQPPIGATFRAHQPSAPFLCGVVGWRSNREAPAASALLMTRQASGMTASGG